MSGGRPFAMVCALLAASGSLAARAQSDGISYVPPSACLASIPESALWRVAVYVQAELVDSTTSTVAFLPQLDLVAQGVSERVRSLLGGSVDTLPVGEPMLTWRKLGSHLAVVANREGGIARMVPVTDSTSPIESYRTDTTVAHILAQALDASVRSGEYALLWPEDLDVDTLAFHLELHQPDVDSTGAATAPKLRRGFPLFSVAMPTVEHVEVDKGRLPYYPADLEREQVTGDLIMDFVVDTTGHAEMETVKDEWPASLPRLTGEKLSAYEKFRRSVVKSISRTTFKPKRIGGCKVPEFVQMPFGFKVRS
jgi:hypothetical protein